MAAVSQNGGDKKNSEVPQQKCSTFYLFLYLSLLQIFLLRSLGGILVGIYLSRLRRLRPIMDTDNLIISEINGSFLGIVK